MIPSTWREIGGGFFGRPVEPLRYELYGMTGLDPTAFTAGGLAGSSGAGASAQAKAWSVAGRVEVEPILGMVLGVSGYAGDAGGNGKFYLRDRTPVSLRVPVLGWTRTCASTAAGSSGRCSTSSGTCPTRAR